MVRQTYYEEKTQNSLAIWSKKPFRFKGMLRKDDSGFEKSGGIEILERTGWWRKGGCHFQWLQNMSGIVIYEK